MNLYFVIYSPTSIQEHPWGEGNMRSYMEVFLYRGKLSSKVVKRGKEICVLTWRCSYIERSYIEVAL